MGRRTLGHRLVYGHCTDGPDVSPRTAQNAILAARAARCGLRGCVVVSRHHAVWLVCKGLCYLYGGLWIAERGHRPAGVVVHCFRDCAAGGGDECAMVSKTS